MENKFKNYFYNLLKKDTRLWDDETKELNQTLLKDFIDKLDEKLVELFLSDEKTKEKFFIKIEEVFVLKHKELKFFIDENKLNNSYTQYRNKIGLRVGNRLLSERNEVVLDWPFKDCVLEGGMTNEDQKRNEIFFNEVLAKDEIDRLEDPKVFVNWRRYNAKGEEKVKKIKRDDFGAIKENFIIKGNNLLALHSLKEQFAGKVKLIYIDPPYNTGNDGFKYNDKFNRSTYLTFMKNRLEVAREFLRDDGVIFVQCDDNEQAYLKVLMDDIFGEENLNSIISVKVSSESGVKVNANKPVRVKEYLIIYSKTSDYVYKKQFVKNEKFDSNYSYYLKNRSDLPEKWETLKIKEAYKEEYDKEPNSEDLYNFQLKNKDRIFSVRDMENKSKQKYRTLENDPNQFIPIETRDTVKVLYKKGVVTFFENKVNLIDGVECGSKHLSDIWTDISWDGIAKEGEVTLKKGKKPEKLLKRIIEMSTNEGDIVLDFFVGSGTTLAVAHKMGRQYVGVEQLDYIENDSVIRLSNVISGDKTGVSKSVNWKRGGVILFIASLQNGMRYQKRRY